jgi:hypothetical protein
VTKSLKTAFAKAAKLPAKQQDALAAFLLEELASEKKWQKQFAASQDELPTLAREAIGEFKAGKTKPLDESFCSVKISRPRRSRDCKVAQDCWRPSVEKCARSGDRRTTELVLPPIAARREAHPPVHLK